MFTFSERAERFAGYLRSLQDSICSGLEMVDGLVKFQEDLWERPGGGGGRTRVISNGAVFEKGGVNFSFVHGTMPQKMAERMGVDEVEFLATGVSLVIHPFSPRVPTVHANFRYFEQSNGDAWFGGGLDLTPYIADEQGALHFHQTLHKACQPHGPNLYADFKKECDQYFFIRHRAEARGIGGLFYDYLRGDQAEMDAWEAFQNTIGNCFLDAYIPVVERHKDDPFTEREKKFQLLRRGRYVEFNLVYDRGTLFGLETDGRVESILMSLPAIVHFDYCADMEQTASERQLMGWLRHPREWV